MSQQMPEGILSFIAEVDLSASQYCLVTIGTAENSVKLCGTTDTPIGVLQNAPALGGTAAVCTEGTSLVKANGAFSKGDKLASAASSGKVDTVSGTVNIIGVALEAAGKADVLVEMFLRPADAIATVSAAACEATVTERQTQIERTSGDIVASVAATIIDPHAVCVGVIDDAGFSLANTGTDSSNPLALELDVLINGTSIFTAKPKLLKTAADAANTWNSGTGVTVGVIDAAKNIVAVGDVITYSLTLTRTPSPGDEMDGAVVRIGRKNKVGA